MVRLTSLSEEEVDLLLYCLSGVLPSVRVCDLGVQLKGEARDAVRGQYLHKLRRFPTRLRLLSEELDNLPQVAMRLGYPESHLSSHLQQLLTTWKLGQGMATRLLTEGLGAADGQQHHSGLRMLGDAPGSTSSATLGEGENDHEEPAVIATESVTPQIGKLIVAPGNSETANTVSISLPKMQLPAATMSRDLKPLTLPAQTQSTPAVLDAPHKQPIITTTKEEKQVEQIIEKPRMTGILKFMSNKSEEQKHAPLSDNQVDEALGLAL